MIQKLLPLPFCIGFIVAFGLAITVANAGDPPADLIRKMAQREAGNEAERANYMYRQTVMVEEVSEKGLIDGHYREVHDVIFSPTGERSEEAVGKPVSALKNLKLTPEDFADLREVQPFLFTPDRLFLYESKYRGEEDIDGVACWMIQVRPKQILEGQRLFDGVFWVDQRDFSIVRSEGQAVPNIHRGKEENLFPRFTTIRAQVDGKNWFPVKTYADDTLYFRKGPQRMRLIVRYANYKRFNADTTITYGDKP